MLVLVFTLSLVKANFVGMFSLVRVFLIVALIACTVFSGKSQNLIANGGFENSTNNDCYGSFDHHTYPNPHLLDYWYNFNSPDYFHSTCTGWYAIPNPYFGDSHPKQGNAFTGIGVYDMRSNYNEYIYQQLNSPLQSGQVYCLSFFVSRADRFPFAIMKIGAYFSNTLPVLTTYEYINATPQVVNQNGFITDTVGWVQIQGCFVASGGEQYITIGNFNNNVATDTLRIPSSNLITGTGTDVSYYYIDEVTLFNQGTVGFEKIGNDYTLEVYPNPTTGLIKFGDERYGNGDYNVKVLDLFGKEMINEILKEELDISSFNKGVYTLLLYKNKQLIVTKKVMKD